MRQAAYRHEMKCAEQKTKLYAIVIRAPYSSGTSIDVGVVLSCRNAQLSVDGGCTDTTALPCLDNPAAIRTP